MDRYASASDRYVSSGAAETQNLRSQAGTLRASLSPPLHRARDGPGRAATQERARLGPADGNGPYPTRQAA
ncbi:MAG: hypothetical protein OXU20_07780 [Myxococcales bacterium]|nr:hypothetical protein [Myxococcales bacterium]